MQKKTKKQCFVVDRILLHAELKQLQDFLVSIKPGNEWFGAARFSIMQQLAIDNHASYAAY